MAKRTHTHSDVLLICDKAEPKRCRLNAVMKAGGLVMVMNGGGYRPAVSNVRDNTRVCVDASAHTQTGCYLQERCELEGSAF